jgi:hypothetical protein
MKRLFGQVLQHETEPNGFPQLIFIGNAAIFSSEHGDDMFLRKVFFYAWVYMASQPKRTNFIIFTSTFVLISEKLLHKTSFMQLVSSVCDWPNISKYSTVSYSKLYGHNICSWFNVVKQITKVY